MLRKKISFIVLVLACFAVVGGCGAKGGGPGRGSGGGGGGTPTGNPVFVSNSSGSVSTYLLDPSTGSLQTITGSPVNTGGTSPDSMAVDPTHAHLLVTNLAAGTTAVFSVDSSTGLLQPVTGSPFQTSLGQVRIMVHPNGNFAYTLVNSPSEVIGYNYSSTSGALTPLAGFPITLGFPGASGLAITSTGKFLYASNPAANTISSFSIDTSTGALTLVGTATSVSGAPAVLTLDDTSTLLFGLNTQNNTVSVFTISSTGLLTEVNSSPFSAGQNPVNGVFADGILYVANQNAGTVSALALNRTTDQLTPISGSPFAAGTRPVSLAVSSGGKFLVVTTSSSASGVIDVFAIGSGGTLTPVSGSPFNPDAQTPNQILAF
jgi:6-phosphogluconolactonase (cycloisomerase 2 family)